MRFVCAPDSFKESMTSIEAIDSMEKGIKKAIKNSSVDKIPMADGGEGITESLVIATSGKYINTIVKDPLGRDIETYFGLLGDGETAIIELAKASGLELLDISERNPMKTTTYGVGQLILKALDLKVKNIIIGLGGSATNDCGIGMLSALGVKFMDEFNNEIFQGGESLGKIKNIDITNLDSRIVNVNFEVACDVNNPLIGPEGATYVFSKQKGASREMQSILEEGMISFNNLVRDKIGIDMNLVSGSGAAGGAGGGIVSFLKGNLIPGAELVIKYTGLEEKISKCDFVFTGEGLIDFQTKYGKTPVAVSKIAKKYSKPVIVFCGGIGEGVECLYEEGITSIVSILNGVSTLKEALNEGQENMSKAVENICRIISI